MKKLKWELLLACALTLAGSGAALAQAPTDGPTHPPKHGPMGPRVFGKVTAVTENTLTVQGPRGEAQTIYVNAETRLARLEKPATLSEFKAGDFVGATGQFNESKQFVAVHIFGGDQPPQRGPMGGPGMGRKNMVAGKITAINGNAVTVLGRHEETRTFYLNEKTTVDRNGEAATIADFKVGDFIGARGETDEKGQFNATHVRGGNQPPQHGPMGGPGMPPPPPGERP